MTAVLARLMVRLAVISPRPVVEMPVPATRDTVEWSICLLATQLSRALWSTPPGRTAAVI